jgi:threonine aldolase
MNFASDNVYGVHPKILASLMVANEGTAPSYAYDDLSKQAEEELCRVFDTDVRAFLVVTGTAANGLALSALTPPYGAVICHSEAHISVDECNSPELMTGGAKIMGLKSSTGKITPTQIEKCLKSFIRGEHDPKPAAVSITNATELGTIYLPAEVKAISNMIRPRNIKLHMDGARFANALVGAKASAADMTWKAGVDALSFGGTKNGAMFLEAVIFFDQKLAEDFTYRRMRSGQLVSKSRYLAAQMLAYLKDDLWLHNARIANSLATELAEGLRKSNRVRMPNPVQANEVFAIMPRTMFDSLNQQGAHFYDWGWDDCAEDEVMARFVMSFATPKEHIATFLKLVAAA